MVPLNLHKHTKLLRLLKDILHLRLLKDTVLQRLHKDMVHLKLPKAILLLKHPKDMVSPRHLKDTVLQRLPRDMANPASLLLTLIQESHQVTKLLQDHLAMEPHRSHKLIAILVNQAHMDNQRDRLNTVSLRHHKLTNHLKDLPSMVNHHNLLDMELRLSLKDMALQNNQAVIKTHDSPVLMDLRRDLAAMALLKGLKAIVNLRNHSNTDNHNNHHVISLLNNPPVIQPTNNLVATLHPANHNVRSSLMANKEVMALLHLLMDKDLLSSLSIDDIERLLISVH